MRLLSLALLVLVAASCGSGNVVGTKDGLLYGNWKGSTARVDAWDGGVSVHEGNFSGDTDGPVFPGFGGRFEARGFWVPSATPEHPNTDDLLRRARFSGALNRHTGRLLMIVTDSATGARFVADYFERTPPPPPPASPPPPAP